MFLNVQSFFRPSSDQVIKRVSTGSNGEQSNGGSYDAQFTTDGRYVVFESGASNLVPGDTGHNDIFLKDVQTGVIKRISTGATGQEANGSSSDPQLSADGRYTVFTSLANNLVTGDTNNFTDIFLKDLITGGITRISTSATGEQATGGHSTGAWISVDGQYAIFTSSASNLVAGDTNGLEDIFRKNLRTGAVERISTNAAGQQAEGGSSSDCKFSSDGRYVVFTSWANNLVANDTNGRQDVFLKDLQTGAIRHVSTGSSGQQASNGDSSNAQISADGRYVVFESTASDLVTGDTNGAMDVFLKDLQTGAIRRVSTGSSGQQASSYCSDVQISPDGRYVIFRSGASNLVAGDTNEADDIFLKDLITGSITLISTNARGEQSIEENSYIARFSPDGRHVVFNSDAYNFAAGDTNDKSDIFWLDLYYQSYGPAIVDGRFIETTLAVGSASQVSIAWGDGTSSTVTPVAGQAAFNHAYASTGTKAATVTLVEGALTWNVAHTIDLGTATMVRNTAVADTLAGGAGRDSLTGDAFANILVGNSGNDRLSAAAGNDSLMGGSGNDMLSASSGNDRLIGGLGKDTLTGGTGRDTFVFDDRETSSSKSRADYITDFSGRRGDKIDLKPVDANTKKRGDQKFSFIGDDESFSKAGEVRFEKSKGYTYVYLNTDNDKAAEGVIKIKGAFELQKSWFVL